MHNINSNKSISVVIPNYNGAVLLAKNLPSVYAALKHSRLTYEVIISDDASTDDSVAFIKANYPDVVLISNSTNGGFSVNINKGIAAAKHDLVLLLNSDIKLNDDYFESQIKYFEQPDTFGVMGKIIDEATGKVAESCKYPLPSAFKINHFKNIAINPGIEAYSYYLSGANALVSREKLNELGGFNEIFSPFYHEDLDLSLRAWENGWRCYYEPGAVCTHAVSSTIKSHSSKKRIKTISTRNRLLLHYFHLDSSTLYLWRVITFLSLPFKLLAGKAYYVTAYRLYLQKLKVMRTYKATFKQDAIKKGRYVPFVTVKNNIKTKLDEVLNIQTK
ncbi:glycosyltransferase family 2 protein [Mucilaginibacter celer]|uniref:Glycosyltransferase n=1 Tax=Mucilaginibacter celer TaxID=2305508 RepID=A0A494VJ55_9SPHI|nr:glycosyltransferase family 2 protein [Mucilaginibacter celer]AYL93789.1 glycosyltransferase [Mucilaginibacter celer]